MQHDAFTHVTTAQLPISHEHMQSLSIGAATHLVDGIVVPEIMIWNDMIVKIIWVFVCADVDAREIESQQAGLGEKIIGETVQERTIFSVEIRGGGDLEY